MEFFRNKCAFLLTEEQAPHQEPSKDKMSDFGTHEHEDLVTKLGQLLIAKIQAHSGMEAELFTPEEVLKQNGKSLAPVLYRIATENFIKTSNSRFKIIECRNSTKLVTDWKPRLPEILISLGHQVIVVELKKSFSPYNDFAYAVLRQVNYNWEIRLPRSFFYPDDVCAVEKIEGDRHLLITPSMPDGEFEFPESIKKTLQYDILMMVKASAESAMENHLLMCDLRVGKFDKTFDGVTSIRNVYRDLQQRVRDGQDISFGKNTMQDSQLYMLSAAGDTIMAAEALLREYNDETVKPTESDTKRKESGDGDGAFTFPPKTIGTHENEAVSGQDNSDKPSLPVSAWCITELTTCPKGNQHYFYFI